jgi:diacylglycerol O-acyltransferase / wax synthase
MMGAPGGRSLVAVTTKTTPTRLSPLDASFLEVESPTAHMHVGWVALLDPPGDRPPPTFQTIRRHFASRLARAPRYRQKLAFVPFGIHDPVWVDDPDFDLSRHVRHSKARDLDHLIERVFSRPLDRDRSLWELWVADRLPDGRIGMVGKVHHCMVDGIAAVEFSTVFLDLDPDAKPTEILDWQPGSSPGRVSLFAQAVRDRTADELDLVRMPERIARSPRRIPELGRTTTRVARSLVHSVTPAARPSRVNQEISPLRSLARVRRPMSDLKAIKARHGVTVNDVVLAVSAGTMRRYLRRHSDATTKLKAMVPVSVRSDGMAGDLGNEIAFLFVELPCDEPDAVRRLEDIHMVMAERKATGEPRGSQAVLDAVGYTPHALQHALSHAVAAPRTYNLVVSNIPGPPQTLYLLGCPLREAYPIVPLADRHGISIGFTSVAGVGCFGIYADRKSIPDATLLANHLDESIEELFVGEPAGATVPTL